MGLWDKFLNKAAEYILSRYTFKDPPSWMWKYGSISSSGVSITAESALKFSAYFAPLVITMNTVGILPKQIRRRTSKGSVIYKEHDQYGLVGMRPNPYQSSTIFWNEFVYNQKQHGNGLAWLEGVDSPTGRPTAYWNIKNAEPIFQNGDLLIQVNQLLPNGRQLREARPYREFLHVPNVIGSTQEYGFIWGRPTHHFATDAVGLGKAAEDTSGRYLRNNGALFRYIHTDKEIPKDRRAALQDQINEIKPGGKHENQMPLMDMNMKIQDLQMSLKDVDAITTRTRAIEDSARFFTFPAMHKLGHLERMNFANAYQASQEYRETTVLPVIAPIVDELNYKCLRPSEFESGEVYFHFETKKLLEADPQSRMEFYRGLSQIGALSANQALSLEDMDQQGPDGDLTYIMANMIPTKLSEQYWQSIITAATKNMTPQKAQDILERMIHSNGVH